MTTEQLKPCPFCNADMSSFVQSAEGFCRGEGSTLYVPCDCGAMGPEGKTTDDAIAAWNRRTPVQLSAQTAAGLFEKRSMFGPWIEVERPTDKSVPLYTHPAKTEQPETMTAQELADRIRAGEKWKLAETEQPSLSDAEILAFITNGNWRDGDGLLTFSSADLIERVRALLAQRQDDNKDAERYRKAILYDDNAELLYGLVRSHGPDKAAIDAAFDQDAFVPSIANGAPK